MSGSAPVDLLRTADDSREGESRMAKSGSGKKELFDIERLKELIALMEEHGLTEVDLKRGDEQWRLCRGGQQVMPVVSPPAYAASAPLPAETSSQDESDEFVRITSPTVGTFYSAPTPDDPPFVKVGSKVDTDTIACIVEAMKVFNQIPAEVSGTIVEILVNDGDPVEFGQPLFKVRPG